MPDESRLESLDQTSLQLAECGVIDLAEDGVIAGVNDLALSWLDLPAEEVVGAPLASVLELRLTAEVGTRVPADATLRGRSGSTRDVVVATIDDGSRIVLFDLSAGSSFARSFATGDTRSARGQHRLEVLLSASAAFADARTERDVAELLVDVARRSFDTRFASVHLRGEGTLSLVAGESPLAAHWPDNYGPVGMRTLLGGEVLIARTPEEAEAFMPDAPMAQVFRAAGIHAAISSPLSAKGLALGSVICYFGHPRDFDDEAVPLAESLASQAAQAISRIRLEEESRRAAALDAVTGLPGRRPFEIEVERQLERQMSDLCVMFIDLDRFKAINDELGHAEGDRVLQQLGKRLESIVRAPDIVGRFGGDEFVVLARVAGEAGCEAITERLRAAVGEPYPDLPAHLSISASIGAVLVHTADMPGIVADQLVRIADRNMYAAKNAGGDRVEASSYSTDAV